MCPQIWEFGTGHKFHLNQSSQSSVASASGAAAALNSFLLSVCLSEQLEAIQGLIKYYLNFIVF